MQEIQLREAKATLSAVVDQARAGQPSVITRHGRPEAVVVSFEEWQRLSEVPSLGACCWQRRWRMTTCRPGRVACAIQGFEPCISSTPMSSQLRRQRRPLPRQI